MLIAQQRSAMSGFTYDLLAVDGTVIGELSFPEGAQARNARLKNPAPQRLRSSTDLHLLGEACAIELEYTRRGWNNDTRFELMQGGIRLPSAQVVVLQGFLGRARLLTPNPSTASWSGAAVSSRPDSSCSGAVRRWAWSTSPRPSPRGAGCVPKYRPTSRHRCRASCCFW